MSVLRAVDDYHAGRLRDAREKLRGIDDIESNLLFIALHTRLRDLSHVERAIALATKIRTNLTYCIEDRIQAGIYLSFIRVRTGNTPAGAACIRESKKLLALVELPAVTLEAELSLADAMILFTEDRIAESERAAWSAVYADLELGSRSPAIRPPIASIQVTKARALLLIGIIRGAQERFHEQYRLLREAIVLLRQSPSQDLFLAASLQANRSYYARDLGMLSQIVELELVPHDSWANDLTELRLEIARSLGYLYALNGDDELAIDGFQKGAHYTQSDANRLLLVSDEAFVSRQLPSAQVLRGKLIGMCALADTIDWDSMGTERYALHAFAQELAFVNPSRAAAYIRRYNEVGPKTDPIHVSDRRAQAEAQYSAGIVALANNRSDHARDALGQAFEIWRDVGFRWRAAMAAIELAEATGIAGFASYAARETQQYPRSWLARRVAACNSRAS